MHWPAGAAQRVIETTSGCDVTRAHGRRSSAAGAAGFRAPPPPPAVLVLVLTHAVVRVQEVVVHERDDEVDVCEVLRGRRAQLQLGDLRVSPRLQRRGARERGSDGEEEEEEEE